MKSVITVEIDINKLTKEIALDEARSRYKDEQNRFNGIESKNNYFLALNGFLFSYLSFSKIIQNNLFFIPLIIFLFGIFYSFKTYDLKNIKLLKENLILLSENNKIIERLLILYNSSINEHYNLNEKKLLELKIVILLSKLAWISLPIIIFIDFLFF